MIGNIASVATLGQGVSAVTSALPGTVSGSETFQTLLQQWIKTASDTEQHSMRLAEQFARGQEGVSIHEVMIATQKSLLAIKASTEVTKRCLNAYQNIWNMPL